VRLAAKIRNAMIKKVRDFLWRTRVIIKLLPFLPLALVIRLIRPFVLVRFCEIFASRLGHLAGTVDVYVCQRDADPGRARIKEVIYWFDTPCNRQLANMWERSQPVSALARHIDMANRLLPGHEAHSVPFHGGNDRSGALNNAPQKVFFTAAERARGEARIAEIAPAATNRIACVFNRDSEYLNRTGQGTDYSYHNYRDSRIADYRPMIESLLDDGYTVFRMGEHVAERLEIDNPRYIEFTDFYDDFMDVYLFNRCDLQVGAASGIVCLGRAFRKPTAMVNSAPLFTTSHYRTHEMELFIPKLYWLKSESRYLKTSEVRALNAGFLDRSAQFEDLGIELHDNLPEDILSISKEVQGLAEGSLRFTDDDISLQQAFWALALPHEDCREFFQISPSFVRKYPFLVE